MKPWFAFLAGAACVALGVFLGRGRSPAPVHSVGPVWFLPEASRLPAADSPLMRHIAVFDAHEMPLEKAFDTLRTRSNLNLAIDWTGLELNGISRTQLTDLTLHDVPVAVALNRLLKIAGGYVQLSYTVEDGVITIGVHDRERGVSAIYDINEQIIALRLHYAQTARFFLAPVAGQVVNGTLFSTGNQSQEMEADTLSRASCVEAIIQWIQSTCDPDTWKDNGGSIGSIREMAGYLFVTQTPAVQEQIRSLLPLIHR